MKKILAALVLAAALPMAAQDSSVQKAGSSAGGVTGGTCGAGDFVSALDTNGVPTCSTPASGGAPTDADYLVGTANGSLSNEVVAGTGVMTFAATPSSANLRGALTDETGSGLAVFNNSPTFDLLQVGNAASTGGYINFLEDTDNGSNYVRILGQNSLASNRIFTLPDTADDTFTLNAATQTLSAKTLTAPNIGNGATSGGYSRYLEDTDNGSNYIQLTGQDTLSADRTYTIPDIGGAGIVAVGSTSYPGLSRPKTVFAQFEDFSCKGIAAGAGTIAPCGNAWGVNNSGSTAAGFLGNTITSDGTAPGVAFFSTGTTVTGIYSLNMGSAQGTDADNIMLNGGEIAEVRFQLPEIPNVGDGGNDDFMLTVGFCDLTTSGACTNGIAIRVDETNSMQWQCYAHSDSGGAATSTVSNLVATADVWHIARVELNAAGTSATLSIDGTPLSCSPLTTDLPNGATEGTAVQIKLTGSNTVGGCSAAADCTVGVDYMYVYDPSVVR